MKLIYSKPESYGGVVECDECHKFPVDVTVAGGGIWHCPICPEYDICVACAEIMSKNGENITMKERVELRNRMKTWGCDKNRLSSLHKERSP